MPPGSRSVDSAQLGAAAGNGGPLGRPAQRLAAKLDADKMAMLGIRNTMHLAKACNRLRRGRRERMRRTAWREHFGALAAEAGGAAEPPVRIEDGWAVDTSGSLPHLDEMLSQADEVIAERGGESDVDDRYRAYFRNLLAVEDHRRWPAFLDFATSAPMVATVADYLGFVPALSNTLPIGVRMVESGKHLDELSHLPPRDSQVFHIDPYDHPLVYVIALVRDCTSEQGPFTFLPAAVSQRASDQLDYWSRGRPYRLEDEEVYSAASPDEARRLVYPRGTVLFVDTSRCFHYGARDGESPRFQVMYAYTSVCRSDFTETYMLRPRFPTGPGDTRLKRLVLDRDADEI